MGKGNLAQRWSAFAIAIFIGLVFAVMAILPPAPKGADVPATAFSSARAMTDVRIIAAKPHPTGSAANREVRDYLVQRLEELGARVQISSSFLNKRSLARLNKWSGAEKTEQDIFNIIGIFEGKDRSKPALLLMAHHDTVWDSPGAADDTIGIASIFEIMRAVNEGGTPERDVIVLLTDAEELGLVGARHFFENNPLKDRVGAVINFEARGGGGTANMFQTSRENGAAAKLYARAVKQPSASSLSIFVYNALPNDTDLTPALKKDYTAFNIANIGKAEYYHSPKINSEALDEATLQHMGSQGQDLTRALISAETFPKKAPDATFFDLFGLFTIIYPAFFGWIFLAITAVCYVLSLNRDGAKKDIAAGALRMAVFLIADGILLFALNYMSGGGSGSNYYDRLAAITELETLALLLSLAVFFIVFGHKAQSANARFGAALPLFILAVLGQAFAPTASYFLTLSIMLCGITSLISHKWPNGKSGLWGTVIITAVIIGYMGMLDHLLLQGVGPDMLSVAILPAALSALAILPLYPGLSKPAARYLALAGFVIAVNGAMD